MNREEKFDWDSFEADAIERLLNGEQLTGEDGVLAPLIQRLLQATVDGEMQAHVEQNRPNRRNGKKGKTLKSPYGLLRLEMPRDRDDLFGHPHAFG